MSKATDSIKAILPELKNKFTTPIHIGVTNNKNTNIEVLIKRIEKNIYSLSLSYDDKIVTYDEFYTPWTERTEEDIDNILHKFRDECKKIDPTLDFHNIPTTTATQQYNPPDITDDIKDELFTRVSNAMWEYLWQEYDMYDTTTLDDIYDCINDTFNIFGFKEIDASNDKDNLCDKWCKLIFSMSLSELCDCFGYTTKKGG